MWASASAAVLTRVTHMRAYLATATPGEAEANHTALLLLLQLWLPLLRRNAGAALGAATAACPVHCTTPQCPCLTCASTPLLSR
jgi:hypothetical protein